jgi:hypothetical protein
MRNIAPAVSRLLRTAGFERCTTARSRVRGCPHVYPGFSVFSVGDGQCFVHFEPGLGPRRAEREATGVAMLMRYRGALDSRYRVERQEYGCRDGLLVTSW